MPIKSLKDLNVSGKRVLCRVDFNVTRDKKTGAITDDSRVVAALPTINDLTSRGAKVILCSHFGRPKGRDAALTLKPVAENLARHLGKPVAFADDCVGEPASKAVAAMKGGDVLLLENLRYHEGEEGDDAAFAKQLAGLADCYVNDAFGAAHRAHASVHAAAKLFADRAAGYLMQKEVEYLTKALKSPEHPFVAILGGAKVSDKIQVIESLLPICDTLLIGGAMAYTFLKAQGLPTGKSLVEPDQIETAKKVLGLAKEKGKKLLLPVDHAVADKLEKGVASEIVAGDQIPDGKMALDIGPRTAEAYAKEIATAKMIVWNGPQGVFEIPPFDQGTTAVAKAVAGAKATSIVGGGESVAAVKKAGIADKITHISTGGGASLEFLEGQTLPGVAALG
ncbi:MAG: phosphoglycerate kinase [Planctomycetota bacterium]|nr:phosphoglycerate kinase [Planctomycetota bacterium]